VPTPRAFGFATYCGAFHVATSVSEWLVVHSLTLVATRTWPGVRPLASDPVAVSAPRLS
jgi:hypothetical protein